MKLEQTFDVQAPPDLVWSALVDVERVAPCLPGAAVTGRGEDGAYTGEFKVKLGPTTAAYSGVLKMTQIDDAAKVATMDARGTDKRGQGGATASIVSSVHPGDGEGATRVDVVTDFAITGRLARFGRGGMVQDVANRLLREFAANLQAQLQADGAAAAAGPPSDDAPAAGAGSTSDAPDAPAPTGDGDPTAEASAAAPAGSTGAAAPPPPPRAGAAAASGTSILLGALTDRVKREPAQAAGAAAVLLLGLGLLRRLLRSGS